MRHPLRVAALTVPEDNTRMRLRHARVASARPWPARAALAWVLALGFVPLAGAQELDPGAYAVAPIGVNVFILTNSSSFGDLAFDPAGPIDEASAAINTTVFGYVRVVNVAGRSGQIAIGVPVVAGHLEGRYLGEPAEVDRYGPGDTRVRMAVNLYGAPAMDRKAFVQHRRPRLVGASLTVGVPTGRYSSERLINIGSNRWAFKPEIGLMMARGRWTFETYGGVWLFTKNADFYRGSVRTQDPIGSLQFHVQYMFGPRLLLSANSNFYTGGRTTVNDRENLDLQRNSRIGRDADSAAVGRPYPARCRQSRRRHDDRRRLHEHRDRFSAGVGWGLDPELTCVGDVAQAFRPARARVGRAEARRHLGGPIVNTSELRR